MKMWQAIAVSLAIVIITIMAVFKEEDPKACPDYLIFGRTYENVCLMDRSLNEH